MRTVALHEARTADEVWALIGDLGARSLLFDVEPFVALWETGTATLDAGVAETLRRAATVGGVRAVCFATNSSRLPTALPGPAGVRVGYRACAVKPLATRGFRDLPRPGLVIGDQLATDGTLAWRLGFGFVHYRVERDQIPLGPRVMGLLGEVLRPLLFRPA